MAGQFRFSFGPWNIHEGADPFGPAVRPAMDFAAKLKTYKKLGFDAVQFHDDDAVPGLDKLTTGQIVAKAKEVRSMLDGEGLAAEFVAPRLWEAPGTVDGAYTSNDPACRRYAIEPKPNEPMDQAYIPTTGHAIALGHLTRDASRVGVNIESAHAILAGLDPSDEMGFALAHDKLFSVHLNDQNGLKFDEDRSFGAIDLRRAFNQVRVLDRHDYGKRGEWVGLDVKAMRTQKADVATKHLSNSRTMFLRLLEVSRSLDEARVQALVAERDYEELDLLIMQTLTGK